jgi:hypothetical protein
MGRDVRRGVDWAGLPVIAIVARLLCRELTLQNEYLRLENRTLKDKIPGRVQFTDEERRSLADAALAMGRSLMKEVVTIVKPETILGWQRRLERRKWDYSERRTRRPGRPRTPGEKDRARGGDLLPTQSVDGPDGSEPDDGVRRPGSPAAVYRARSRCAAGP